MSLDNPSLKEEPKQKEKIDVEQEKQKYDKAFESDSQNPEFDQKTFGEMISGVSYDETKTKEENLRNAFDQKVSTLIDQNLKNLTPENKAELEELKKKASSSLTNPVELLDAFNQVKTEINNRNGESAKAGVDLQNKVNEANSKRISKELQDFVDKLRTSINEHQKLNDEKAKEKQNKVDEMKKAEAEQKNQAEDAISGFPTPEKKA